MNHSRRIVQMLGCIALLSFITGCATPTANTIAIENPGFEEGLSGWKSESCDAIGPERFPASGRNGTHMAAIGVGNKTKAFLEQQISLPKSAGSQYKLQFDFGAIGDRGRVAVLRVDILSGSKVLATKTFTNHNPQRDYKIDPSQITIEDLPFSIDNDTGLITVRFSDLSPHRGIAVDPAIDNVSLSAVK